MEQDAKIAGLKVAFPTLTAPDLERALQRCEGPVTSTDDLLCASSTGFFDVVASSIIMGTPSMTLNDSLPGLSALADFAVPDGTFTTRPHKLLRQLRRGSLYTWGDIGALSPCLLLTIRNMGIKSATEIIRVAARKSVSAFSSTSADGPGGHPLGAASATRTVTPPSPVLRALATVAAWLDVATEAETIGEVLQLASGRQAELPDDVARAWATFSETPLSWIAEAITLDLPEQLQEFDEALGDSQARTIFWARIQVDAPTLDSLGAALGLSRERVRQVQAMAEEEAGRALMRPELAALRWQAAMLRQTLGIAFPESAAWASVALDKAARRGSEEWYERLRVLLLWIAGPYHRDRGWLVRGTIPTRTAVMPAIDESRRVDMKKAEAALCQVGLAPEAVNEWLDCHLPVRRIGDEMFVWEGSVADKAYILLNAWGRPASADELADAVGEGHGLRSTRSRLLEDVRFKRVDRVRIGLRSWSNDEYTGIVDELTKELKKRGGESEIRDLVVTVADKCNVRGSSVEAYTAAPRFVIEGARIRLRGVDEPYLPCQKLTDEPRCYLVSNAECTYRMVVDHEVLRGSGRPIPEGLGSWLGVVPPMRREFVFGDEVVVVTWPDSSFTGPSIGSVRRIVVAFGASDGDQLLLRFNREHSTGTAALVTASDLAVEPERRVTALTGVVVEGSVLDTVARAIGASTSSVKERLRRRGEADLLEALSSASLHLDIALDRLREVL